MTETCMVAKGTIPVPPGTPTHDFAAMEAAFRDLLWPKPQHGWQVFERRLAFNKNRTTLRYAIKHCRLILPLSRPGKTMTSDPSR